MFFYQFVQLPTENEKLLLLLCSKILWAMFGMLYQGNRPSNLLAVSWQHVLNKSIFIQYPLDVGKRIILILDISFWSISAILDDLAKFAKTRCIRYLQLFWFSLSHACYCWLTNLEQFIRDKHIKKQIHLLN